MHVHIILGVGKCFVIKMRNSKAMKEKIDILIDWPH